MERDFQEYDKAGRPFAAYEALPGPFGICSASASNFIFLNAEARRLLNLSTGETLPKPKVLQRGLESLTSDVTRTFHGKLSNLPGNPVPCRFRVRRMPVSPANPDGDLVACDLQPPSADNQRALGASRRFAGVFNYSPISLWQEDCSGLKQHLDTLRTTHGDIRAYLADHPEEITTCFQKIRVVDINQATVVMYAAHDKQQLMANMARILPDESLGSFLQLILHLHAGHTTYRGDIDSLRLDGSPFTASVQIAIAPGAEQTWREVIVSVMDVTDLRLARQRLERSSDFFLHLFTNFPFPVWRADRNAAFDFLSDAWEEVTGQDPAQGLGDGWTTRIDPADLDGCVTAYLKAVSNREPFVIEVRLRGPEREPETASRAHVLRGAPYTDLNGNYGGYLGMFIDISETRELHQQLLQAQKMDALGRMAGGIAHDFNNLLTTIVGLSEIARDDISPTHTLHKDLDDIHSAACRAAEVIRQLLTFSRGGPFDQGLVEINDCLRNLCRFLQRTIGPDIQFLVCLPENPIHIGLQRTHLDQIITNLAINARDAMPNGGKLFLSVFHDQVPGSPSASNSSNSSSASNSPSASNSSWVCLEFIDTGTGMSREVLDRLFEPFYTTKGPGKGSGLGLAMVYGLVTGCGGVVEVDSALDRGTRFRLFFPPVVQPLTEQRVEEVVGRYGGTEHLIIVEDEPGIRLVLERLLQNLGYCVAITAANGEEALRLTEAYDGPIDLVVSDVVMPLMRGPEFIGRLRQQRDGFKTLYITGFAEEALELELGTDGCILQKPFTMNLIARTIRELLDA